jgi:CBS domain containing-hemolysin-like protein
VESDGAGADFGGLEVSDLMRPINEVVAMYKSQSQENMETAARHRFSRYPYFDEDEKTVLGGCIRKICFWHNRLVNRWMI